MAAKQHLVKIWILAKSKVLAIVLIFFVSAAVTVDAFELMGRWNPSGASQTGNIYRYWWFKALAVALLANLTACTIDRIIRQLKLKGRIWSRWGSVAFHGGMAVIIAGTFFTGSYRTYSTIKLVEGETKQIPYQALTDEAKTANDNGPEVSLTLSRQEITPDSSGRIKEMLSHVTLSDNMGLYRQYDLSELEQFSYQGLYMFPKAYGYAVRLSIKNSRADSEQVTVPLQTTEFNDGIKSYSEKKLHFASLPYDFSINFYPDIAVDGNTVNYVNRSYELKNPGLYIMVNSGNRVVAQETLPMGGTVQFDDYSLTFIEVKPWTELSAVYDPGANMVFFGIMMGIIGLSIKLFKHSSPGAKKGTENQTENLKQIN